MNGPAFAYSPTYSQPKSVSIMWSFGHVHLRIKKKNGGWLNCGTPCIESSDIGWPFAEMTELKREEKNMKSISSLTSRLRLETQTEKAFPAVGKGGLEWWLSLYLKSKRQLIVCYLGKFHCNDHPVIGTLIYQIFTFFSK